VLTWGILGAGSVAQRRVIPSMKAVPSCEVGALMVRDQGRADALAKDLEVPRAYSSVDDLLADDKLDAIYVSSPVNLHPEHAIAVAESGKHVLCEKPMALTSDGCRRIIAACEAADVHLQVCFVLRGWPIYQRLRTMMTDGSIGRFVSARAHLAKWMPWDDGSWRRDVSQSGGGVLVDVGTHYLDLFRYLFGEITDITYRGGSPVLDIEVEETAHTLVSFENGGHGSITASIVVPHNGNVLEIYGTKGSIFLGSTLRIVTDSGEQTEEVVFPDYFSGLLDQFVTCVERGGDPIASGQDGLRNIELVEQAYASAR
jgi:predicted dehydrogenase